jgi:ADP-ribose pyrophosphatase
VVLRVNPGGALGQWTKGYLDGSFAHPAPHPSPGPFYRGIEPQQGQESYNLLFYPRHKAMHKHEMLYRGRYLSLFEDDGWEYASRSNASGVVVLVAVTADDELVLVEQYRIPVKSSVIELPAGLVGDLGDRNEPLLLAAQRELLEETGFEAGQLDIIMSCPSSAGMSDETVTFVRARELKKRTAGGGDASEEISVHLVPLANVDQRFQEWRAAGKPFDPKIFSALYWLDREDTPKRAGRGQP